MARFRRRGILVATAACIAAPRALSQAGSKPRVALLFGGKPSDSTDFVGALLGELRTLGYQDRRTVEIDARYANYSTSEAERLAVELAGRKPAAIVASGGGIEPAVRLVRQVPIVFVHSGDPVDAGFADSLPRPGRNATGISLLALDLISKRMEFLKQVRPTMQRVALLASPEHPGQLRELAASRAAAAQFGVEVVYHEARTPAELAAALPRVPEGKPDAALIFSDALMLGQRQSLATFFLAHKIPSGAGYSAFPDSGHVMSYGPERLAVWRRTAHFVDRIVKGAQPAAMPIELPTVFELVINRRSASAMGLVVPQQLLVRADRVIE
jgi:putative tryptophan/tyrosine transport system substrate-binding protein